MTAELRFKYTPEARKRIVLAKQKYIREIQKYLKNTKYVPGDRIIEITASDIDNALNRTIIIKSRRNEMYKLLSFFYIFVGIILTMSALFYSQIKYFMTNNPEQLMMLIAGITMASAGFLLSYFKTIKNKIYEKDKELEREINYKKF